MLGGDLAAGAAHARIGSYWTAALLAHVARVTAWVTATALLALCFAVIYYWAPGVKKRRWRWLTPGGALGVFGWLIASLGLRLYLHFFNFYSLTYGSLGAVIILLMWFYLTGFMLLLGAEINGEIEATATEMTVTGRAPSAETPPSIPDVIEVPPIAGQPLSSGPKLRT
jgi:membrane protein